MSDLSLADLIQGLKNKADLTAQDALAARRAVYDSVEVTQAEAEGLVALTQAAAACSPEWSDTFVEALTDYVVNQRQPSGYVDQDCADWLTSQLLQDGRIASDTELELLVRVLERAATAPASLITLALQQVKIAVVEGAGPLRRGLLDPGRITRGEVELVRRILYAAGGDDNLAITRQEADLLFDINDACRLQANDGGWADLFSKAIVASVMTISGYEPMPREERVRLNTWLATPERGLGDFMGRMFQSIDFKTLSNPQASFNAIFHPGDGLEAARAENDREAMLMQAAESISDGEAEWLSARIGKDGVFDAAERAVIDFIQRESPFISPGLQRLMDAAATDRRAAKTSARPVFGKRVA